MAQLASTSEEWKQQRTRRNLRLCKLVERLRDSRNDAIADLLKKQDGGTLFAYNKRIYFALPPSLPPSTSIPWRRRRP